MEFGLMPSTGDWSTRGAAAAAEVLRHQQADDGRLGDLLAMFLQHLRRCVLVLCLRRRLCTVRLPGVRWRQPRLSHHSRLHVSFDVIMVVFVRQQNTSRPRVVVSVVRHMNEVTLRRARLVLGWVDRLWAGIPSRYVTSQLSQLSLASLRGR